jgi:hypothetical protein
MATKEQSSRQNAVNVRLAFGEAGAASRNLQGCFTVNCDSV